MPYRYIPTGNEFISIPELNESNAAIMSFNFLHMGFKGLIEIRGEADPDFPFMVPIVELDGEEKEITGFEWERICYWIPSFKAKCQDLLLEGKILAPVGERGFIYNLKFINGSDRTISFTPGIKGYWEKSRHTINESKDLKGDMVMYRSNWNQSYVFDFRNIVSVFSFAPIFEESMDVSSVWNHGGGIGYKFMKHITLEPGQGKEISFFWGVGYEEVASSTAAKEMLRKGYRRVFDNTVDWLSKRVLSTGNARVDTLLNTNLFFNYFYASGITLDTEELVLVTSRSPRYYVSAAYWDRDSLLWSFPAVLITDIDYAKQILEYVFTRQIRNVGIHSRYIDGTVLEPGFELDELCALIIALDAYVRYTGDKDILYSDYIAHGITRILNILKTKRNESMNLYETFLQPTDDVIVHPYLTYDNVLVWKVFKSLAHLLCGEKIPGVPKDFGFSEEAELVKEAIYKYCIKEYQGKRIFAWSVSEDGEWNIYDEPPGSLQLLAYYGFCDKNDVVYLNTLNAIRDPSYKFSFYGCNIAEIGCEHAPHPWVLSIANSLLCGRKDEFMRMLPYLKMDNGIACESVHETTGESTTGDAFATCAGFLAFAVYHAFRENNKGVRGR